jgi:hypothetical protein
VEAVEETTAVEATAAETTVKERRFSAALAAVN